MNFKVFQNEVRNLKQYERSIIALESKKEDIIYKYGGVHGVSFDRVASTSGDRQGALLKMGEELEEIEREIDHTQLKIEDIRRNLGKLPEEIRNLAMLLYYDNLPLRYVGRMVGYSYNGVYQLVKREVEKI